MSPATALWLKIGLETAVALALLGLASPPVPTGGRHLAAVLAAASYLAAFTFLVRIALDPGSFPWPAVRARGLFRRAVVSRSAVLGLLAASEEVIWRRVVLGELLRWGPTAACMASAVTFGLAHRGRPALHVATGALLGALYLATGALGACICVHWAYNLGVGRRLAGSLVPRQVP